MTNLNQFLQLINQHDITLSEVLNPSNSVDAQEEFFAQLGDKHMRRPNFEYNGANNLSREALQNNVDQLRTISAQIGHAAQEQQITATEQDLLSYYVSSCYYKNTLALSARDLNQANGDYETLARKLQRYNLELYGQNGESPLKYDVFLAMLKQRIQNIKLDRLILEEDQWLYHDLLGHLQGIPWENADLSQIYHPQATTVAAFGDLVRDYFAPILKHLPDANDCPQKEFDAQAVCDLLNRILQTEFANETTLYAVVRPDRKSLGLDQVQRTISIPQQRANGPYTYNVVHEIVLGHEFCTHAYRSIKAEQTGLIPFYQGLPGYLDFEEGVAKCVEQALRGKYRVAGVEHYVNAGLATFANMDFRAVYEIDFALSFLAKCSANETAAEREKRQKATQDRAFNRARRAFSGTASEPYLENLSYYNGSHIAWEYIEQHLDQPETLMRNLFESGKTDLTNSKHRALLQSFLNKTF